MYEWISKVTQSQRLCVWWSCHSWVHYQQFIISQLLCSTGLGWGPDPSKATSNGKTNEQLSTCHCDLHLQKCIQMGPPVQHIENRIHCFAFMHFKVGCDATTSCRWMTKRTGLKERSGLWGKKESDRRNYASKQKNLIMKTIRFPSLGHLPHEWLLLTNEDRSIFLYNWKTTMSLSDQKGFTSSENCCGTCCKQLRCLHVKLRKKDWK